MKEHYKLLIKRESYVVLGHKYVNLWLLTIVLFATFLSIAFSNASMFFLKDKMDDPFTKWVSIPKENDEENFQKLQTALTEDKDLESEYGFSDCQSDVYFSRNIVGKDGSSIFFFRIRFFERYNSDLVKAILSKENVINDCSIDFNRLDNRSLGFVITQEALERLGYSIDSIPSFIHYAGLSEGADTLGISLIRGQFYNAPLPVLAVVKRLPMNMDMVASRCLDDYMFDEALPFNFCTHKEYHTELYYYYKGSKEDFQRVVAPLLPDSLQKSILPFDDYSDRLSDLMPYGNGCIVRVNLSDNNGVSIVDSRAFDRKVIASFPDMSVYRIYNYIPSNYKHKSVNYLSVVFQELKNIRRFEQFVKSKFGIQLEMSQVNAKENFSAVSIMGTTLSWAMIVFSIVCIIMFVVNLLQSYFQKVKRNLGTFKAFGIDTISLIGVYVIILIAIVSVSVVLAVGSTYCVELLLNVFDIKKDGIYPYLSLWNMQLVWSIIILYISTLVTVYVVMSRLLKKTPGDLIYDR